MMANVAVLRALLERGDRILVFDRTREREPDIPATAALRGTD
jgi:hypothetical protein